MGFIIQNMVLKSLKIYLNMRKIILLISLLFLFCGCKNDKTIYKNNILIISSSSKTIERKMNELKMYKYSNLNKTFSEGKLRINFIDDSTKLKIKCSSNTGFGGESIEIIISNKLNIHKITYNYSGDTVDDKTENYQILNSKTVLNKNPFTEGVKNLNGFFFIKGLIKIVPNSLFEFSRVEKFEAFGEFVYDK